MEAQKKILICRCAERRLLAPRGETDRAQQSGEAVVLDDLCMAAARRDPVLREIAAAKEPEIHACHPRAVRALFAFAGAPLPPGTRFHNLRCTAHDTPEPAQPNPGPPAPGWYPVLEFERCTGCGQCLKFCLFGVYEKDPQGAIRVAQPGNCKNNCPACARICPVSAIIFPKAGEEPINGAEIPDPEARTSRIKHHIDTIRDGDPYSLLRARQGKRNTLLNRRRIEQAIEERRRCSGDPS